jgi:hypothetical protein
MNLLGPFRIRAEQWRKLTPEFLPFADAATGDLPLSRLLRLSLFQVTVGMAGVLLERLNPNLDPAELRELVEGMARTTDSAVHLANRLLTLARAEHGAAEGGTMRVSLTDAARQVALELSQQAVSRRIGLAFEEEGDIGIEANTLLLHELMVNLLDNAIRYTPVGGQVTLRVRAVSRPGEPTGALLEVEDNGPGIAEAEREAAGVEQLDAEAPADLHLTLIEGRVGAGSTAGGPIANRIGAVLFEQMQRGDDVALRLRHLLAVGVEHPTGDAGVPPGQ